MFDGPLVFAQLMDFLPRREFNACVDNFAAIVAAAAVRVATESSIPQPGAAFCARRAK